MSTDPSARARGFASVATGALLLGFSAIFVRWAQEASPEVIGFYRMAIALPLTLLLARFLPAPGEPHREGPQQPGRGAAWALLGGLVFTTDLFLWQTAIRHTSAANATLLVGLAPLWVLLFSALFLKARFPAGTWMGFLLALGGAAVLGLAKGARLGSGFGELLSAGASFCYGGYTLCLGLARRDLDGPRAMTCVTLAATLGFGALSILSGQPMGGFSGRTWAALAGLGVMVQVIAWWFISRGLGRIPTSLGALALLLQQVATVILAWMLLDERPVGLQLLGILLVLAGLGLCTTRPANRIKHSPTESAGKG